MNSVSKRKIVLGRGAFMLSIVLWFYPATTYSQEGATEPELKLSGDLRFRHESTESGDEEIARHRERLRFRVGIEQGLSDNLKFGLRLRLGSPTDARSSYIDLGDGFDPLEVNLDRLFVEWRSRNDVAMWAGKFPLNLAGNLPYAELLWDEDVQPEGVAFRCEPFAEGVSFSAGQFVTVENRFATDGYLTTSELGWHGSVGDVDEFACALSYLGWSDVSPGGNFAALGLDDRGNRLNPMEDDFLSDFRIMRLTSSWSRRCANWDLTLADEWIRNFGAENERDAYAIGLSTGPVEGKTRIFYQWQTVDEDAVFTPVSQDDFLQGSGFRGHVFGCKRSFGETVSLGCWGLVSKDRRSAASDQRGRFRLDLDFKF